MKVAFISSPLDTGNSSGNSFFRLIHDFAKVRMHWNRMFRPLTRRILSFDFQDYPLCLVQLATMIKDDDEVKIYNFLEHDYMDEVIAFAPDVIGITCPGGGNLVWIDDISRVLKEKLGCKFLFGGPHVTLTPEQTLRTTVADYVFIGESDLVVKPVIDFIAGRTDTLPEEGIGYWKDGQVVITPGALVPDLTVLPAPDHSLVDIHKYKSVNVELSRGCSNRCPFCYLSGHDNYPYWRIRSEESILSEIRAIMATGHKRISFVDNNFADDNERLSRVLNRLIDEGAVLSFWTGIDVNVSAELMQTMKKAGGMFVFAGLESGSDRYIKKFAKLKSRESILEFVRNSCKHGLWPTFTIILMNPEETKEDLKETLRFCREIAKVGRKAGQGSDNAKKLFFYSNIYRPSPRSPDHKRLAKKGWKEPNSFRDWGNFFNEVAVGDFSRANFTSGISKAYLMRILIEFGLLNMRVFVIPSLWFAFTSKLSGLFKRNRKK